MNNSNLRIKIHEIHRSVNRRITPERYAEWMLACNPYNCKSPISKGVLPNENVIVEMLANGGRIIMYSRPSFIEINSVKHDIVVFRSERKGIFVEQDYYPEDESEDDTKNENRDPSHQRSQAMSNWNSAIVKLTNLYSNWRNAKPIYVKNTFKGLMRDEIKLYAKFWRTINDVC